ncbi:MAG: UDP-N-acetylmuramoyl-L-alanine--D-glutamate ligase, partial [Clostridia bacterium]|nr:UDP-N-acetylmuramoyl-L-alanine--D-glutamate ligase [Clostridia bacterium]
MGGFFTSKTLSCFLNEVKGKRIALLGAGKSNRPLVKMFVDAGAAVTVCDKKDKEQLAALPGIAEYKDRIKFKTGPDYLSDIDADIILRTPGISALSPALVEYKKRGIAVTSEAELFCMLCPAKIIAVTGSNGKTTTTTLIYKMLREQGHNAWLGGNIGMPLLPLVGQMSENDIAVMELSSFQLMNLTPSPDVSVITNIYPNHLDYHRDMEEYVGAKRNIFLHQDSFSRTVLNMDDDVLSGFSGEVIGRCALFSAKKRPNFGAYLNDNNQIMFAENEKDIFICNRNELFLPGKFNLQNFLAAVTAVWGIADIGAITEVARTFKGVRHRIQYVRTVDGVRYYNDSIATSPSRVTEGILTLFDERIIIIAGGYDKNIPFETLGDALAKKTKAVVLMGKTAEK